MTEHRLSRAVSRAGITREQWRIACHDLRHTYGSQLAMRGGPLKVIQELMGHATIAMDDAVRPPRAGGPGERSAAA
jgi:integrase